MTKGTIKAYSETVNAGVITGPDGKTYGFAKTDWLGAHLPRVDQIVTFETVAARQAMKVEDQTANSLPLGHPEQS